MKLTKNAALAAILLPAALGAAAWADCSYPRAPEKVPDGNTATMQEMVAAQKQIKQYNQDMETYLSCIKGELDDQINKQGTSLTEEQKKQMSLVHAQKNDAAVDELQTVAARFNEQVRVYKAKHPAK